MLLKDVLYELENEKALMLANLANGKCVYISFEQPNDKIDVAKYKSNRYFLVQDLGGAIASSFIISHKGVDYSVTAGEEIFVFANGVQLLHCKVENLIYSKNSTFGDYLLLHFDGKRKYVVVLKNGELVFADFLDEYNAGEKEKYFMCKVGDSLNHGKVLKLTETTDENYLVYLDDAEMKLKSKFVANVFMDALKVGNYKYCNNLLSQELKQNSPEDIKKFFPDFDDFVVLEENAFAVTQKNAIAGIFEFEIEDNLIVNINSLL